ncbi:MAG: hypothetical protein KDB74_06450 [Flavobacteriales bacterium]|nr:hypothetical protein [Flavobacteriales bacterium]
MKKKVLFIAAIAAAVFTTGDLNAQDFKPAGGEKNVEVNFTPLGGKPVSINNIKLRYFSSSDMAFRLGISVSSSSDKTVNLGAGADGKGELEDVKSSFGFSLNPGIEMHWEGTDRLSPYYGAELMFSTVSNKETNQVWDAADATTREGEKTSGSTTFGLNLLIGADWYFTKSMYMGTEVGFGFASVSEKDTENTPAVKDAKTATAPGGSTFNLGPNFNSSIRLGFLF